jgi:pimeloyl-ACP methyl ester carboxylesterase
MPMEIAGLKVERAAPRGPERGHPILFIHGMWGGSWMWDNYLGAFAGRGYACYALNLRGHHGSRPVADIGRVPFAAYVEDARAVAAALGNPILVGHSMGGLLVQKLAEGLTPPAVVALTPAAPRGIFPLCTLELARLSLRHLPEFLRGRPVTPTFAEADALLFGRLPPAERRPAFERLVPESGRMTFDVAVAGVPVDAARVRCPVLVVAGREDRITPAKMVRKVARKYGAPLRVYDGHAHLVLMEPGWESIARDVADWLEHAVAPAPAAKEPR